MTMQKLLKSIAQIGIILLAALLVVGVIYALGQNASTSDSGTRRGFAPPDIDFGAVAETLGVTEEALTDAAGFPPNYEAAAEALELPSVEIEDAFIAAGFGGLEERDGVEAGESGERGGGHAAEGFSLRGIAGFSQTLVPMAIIILVVGGGQSLWTRMRKSRKHAETAGEAV